MLLDHSPENGNAANRYSSKFRSLFIWRYFADYFPIVLHKSVDLEPAFIVEDGNNEHGVQNPSHHFVLGELSFGQLLWRLTFWWYYYLWNPLHPPHVGLQPTGKRYVFGYHPHGIIGMGVVGSIGSEGAGWSRLFPGIPVSVLTLTNQFRVPFYREYLLSLGMASVSKKSCEALLQRNQSICIVVGGAEESLLARPGHMDLILRKRKGFIKLALQFGNVDLVPIVSFGENDLYDQVKNDKESKLYKAQSILKKFLGFTLPLMHARGVFNYDVGVIPYRRPLNIIVGKPIHVPIIENPTKSDIDHYQNLYIKELTRVFDDNKQRYFVNYTGKEMKMEDIRVRLVE